MSIVPHLAGQSRIFTRCPASREMRQICPAFFFKWWLLFVCVADCFTCLPWNSTKWRIKLGSYFARQQTPSIFHAWQPSPMTVYFVTPPAAPTLLPWRALGDGFSLDNRQRSSDNLRRAVFHILGIWDGGGVEFPLKKMASKRKCKFNDDYRSLDSKVACQWHGTV